MNVQRGLVAGRGIPVVTAAGVFLAAGTVSAAVVEVAAGGNVQDAIDRAGPGDTVRLAPGTYRPFAITKDNVRVESAVRGGAHVIAEDEGQPAVAAYGQHGIAVVGLRLTSRRGDGIKVGGSVGADGVTRYSRRVTVADNVVEYAWLDGLKGFQGEGWSWEDNVVMRSGMAGNGNGDGGIDWVQVNGSRAVRNTVQHSGGYACFMMKNGSNGNLVQNNTLQGCRVNGLDLAAPSSGRAAEGNRSVLTAYGNRIEGNVLDSGSGCGIRLAAGTRNNLIAGNRGGRDCGDPTGTNGPDARVDVSPAAGGGRDVSWIDEAAEDLRGIGWTAQAVQEHFRRHGFEVGLPVAAGQLDAVTGAGQGLVADANGDRTRLAESLRALGLGATADEILYGVFGGTVVGPDAQRVLDDAMDFSCGSAEAVGHLSSVGGSVGGFLTGRGKATLPAQIAQQAMLVFQARCAAEQAQAQTTMLRGVTIDTLPDVAAAMTRVLESLGRQQTTTYGVAQAEASWDKAFRDVSGLEDLPPELMVPAIRRHYVDMRTRSADSMAEAARVRAEAVQAMRRNQSAVEAAAAAGQRSQGIRGVIQAGNQVLASAVGQMQQTASFQLAYYEAHSRIQEEERMGAVLARLFHERNIASMGTEGEVLGQVEDAGAPIGLTGPINIRQAPAHAAPQAGMTFGAFE